MTAPHTRILVWMCVLVAVNQLGFGAMIPTMALYAQSFGVSASAIGMAIAAYGLARFASAIPSGQISDRLGRRPSLAIGGLISGIGNLWCAAASSYPEFIVARFVAGFGAGLILTTGQVVLADISTPERRGRMIGIYQGTFLFAVGIGPFPGGLLAERFGLAAPFVANGVLSLLVMAIAWFAVAETRELSADQRTKESAPRPPFATQMRLLNGQIGFVLVSLISLLNAVVRTGGLFALIPLIATTKLGLSVGAIGFAMMLGGIAGLLSQGRHRARHPDHRRIDAAVLRCDVVCGLHRRVPGLERRQLGRRLGTDGLRGGLGPARHERRRHQHLPPHSRRGLRHRPARPRPDRRLAWPGDGDCDLGGDAGDGGRGVRPARAGDASGKKVGVRYYGTSSPSWSGPSRLPAIRTVSRARATSARAPRSASQDMVFIAAIFSATATLMNWFSVVPSSAASLSASDFRLLGRRSA
jgi:MFS family permease